MELPANSDSELVNIYNADETVVMNLTGFHDFDEESLIIMRTGVTNKSQILDKIKYANEYAGTRLYHDANSTSSELEKRLLLVNIQGVQDIPNGTYLLYRMQEKSYTHQNPVEVQNSEEDHNSVEIIYDSGMGPSTVNFNSNESQSSAQANLVLNSHVSNPDMPDSSSSESNKKTSFPTLMHLMEPSTVNSNSNESASSAQPNLVLNSHVSNQDMLDSSSSESNKKTSFHTLVRFMEPLKQRSSFTFDDVKKIIRENHIQINSRQLTTFLFRAQKKRILGKLPGYKRYTFRSN